jgi:hypothetical protein
MHHYMSPRKSMIRSGVLKAMTYRSKQPWVYSLKHALPCRAQSPFTKIDPGRHKNALGQSHLTLVAAIPLVMAVAADVMVVGAAAGGDG